jgi:hypothetical protein
LLEKKKTLQIFAEGVPKSFPQKIIFAEKAEKAEEFYDTAYKYSKLK